MNLPALSDQNRVEGLHLAPDIQEAILFLPLTTKGRDPIREKHVRPIAAELHWKAQRAMWGELVG